jgi:hypothetical protein
VREAAEEALKVLPSVGSKEVYRVHHGFYNPWVTMPGFLPEWRVDVLNANQVALLFRFRLEELETIPDITYDTVCARAVLRAFDSLGDIVQRLDTIILMGDLVAEAHPPTHFGVAILGLSPLKRKKRCLRRSLTR